MYVSCQLTHLDDTRALCTIIEMRTPPSSRRAHQSLFREIVDTTGGGLAQFIAEYEKLQQALRKSHESETRYTAI